jgi:hypothetical protein
MNRLWVAFAAGASVCAVLGCQPTVAEETALFEQAELCYLHGDYEGARIRYERFVELHSSSPLVTTAQTRLLTIDRELDSVMGRRGAPAPIRVNPYGATAAEPEMVEAPALRAPTLPELSP